MISLKNNLNDNFRFYLRHFIPIKRLPQLNCASNNHNLLYLNLPINMRKLLFDYSENSSVHFIRKILEKHKFLRIIDHVPKIIIFSYLIIFHLLYFFFLLQEYIEFKILCTLLMYKWAKTMDIPPQKNQIK